MKFLLDLLGASVMLAAFYSIYMFFHFVEVATK